MSSTNKKNKSKNDIFKGVLKYKDKFKGEAFFNSAMRQELKKLPKDDEEDIIPKVGDVVRNGDNYYAVTFTSLTPSGNIEVSGIFSDGDDMHFIGSYSDNDELVARTGDYASGIRLLAQYEASTANESEDN